MNKLFAVIFASLALLAGCEKNEEVLPKQKEQIVSFLQGSHAPVLIPEEQIPDKGELPYYSTLGDAVYRYIDGAWNPDRLTRKEISDVSRVTIIFRNYVFTNKAITSETFPYYTNDVDLREALIETGLDVSSWSFNPLVVDMQNPGILKGMSVALLGCREGDSVEAYITYNMAYGDKFFGTIPIQSPIASFFTVVKVE